MTLKGIGILVSHCHNNINTGVIFPGLSDKNKRYTSFYYNKILYSVSLTQEIINSALCETLCVGGSTLFTMFFVQ